MVIGSLSLTYFSLELFNSIKVNICSGKTKNIMTARRNDNSVRLRRVLKASLTGVVLLLVSASLAKAESLSAELSRLASDHPLVKAARANIDVAQEGINQAVAGYYPTVTLNSSMGHQAISNPGTRSAFAGGTRRSPTSNLNNNSVNITVTQNLFNGFNTRHSVRGQEILREVNTFSMDAARQQVFLEGTTAYLNVLRAQILVREAMSNVDNFAEQFDAEKKREEQGAGLSVDRITAEQRLLVARSQLLVFESQFREAEATYEQVFGHRPDLVDMNMPPSQRASMPDSVEDAIRIGLRENPSLRAIGRSADGIGELKRAAKSGYYPNINLSATALRDDDVGGSAKIKREQNITLTATWDIFNGFLTRAQVASAAFQQAATKEQETDLSRRTREFVERFWHQFTSAETRIEVLTDAVNAAKDMVTLRQEQFDSGDGRLLDVLDAQSAVHGAEIELANAKADGLIAQFSLLQSMGRLTMDHILFDN